MAMKLRVNADPTIEGTMANPLQTPGRHRGGAVRQPRLDRLLDSVGAQEVRERLPMPELLVDPAGEKGGDVRIGGGAGREQVAQVDHRVGLDVHHVVHAHHVSVGEVMVGDLVPVEVTQIHLLGVAHVAVDVEVDDGLLLHLDPRSLA